MISYYTRMNLIEDYKNGMSLSELSSKYTCSEVTIKRIIKKSGIVREESIYRHKIRKAYISGWSIFKIVKEYHISRRSIYRICVDLIPKKINNCNDDIMDVYYLYISDVPKVYLCNEYHIDFDEFKEYMIEAKIILKGDKNSMSRRYLAFAEICTSSYDTFKEKVQKMNNSDLKQTYNKMKEFCEKDHVMDILQVASNLKNKYEYICELMKSRELLI